ncbi:MAG: NYN domain-containing protein [Desulfamplus sp.]|nr:NYN domain-containing protein [Desulfamplus sp.]
MSSSHYLPDNLISHAKAMMFVDGENLAIRFKELLRQNEVEPHISYLADTFVWSSYANIPHHRRCEVVRKYYYTAVQGDLNKVDDVINKLKEVGIETPRVFKKQARKKSKQVDITLATDMLTHAYRRNYDIAILVAGDSDYVPLARAVKEEGRRLILWFFEESKGLSKELKQESDYFFDLSWFFLKPQDEIRKYYP